MKCIKLRDFVEYKKARNLSVRANLTRNITCLVILIPFLDFALSKRNIVLPECISNTDAFHVKTDQIGS